jgi:hypothetical protein
MTCCVMAHEWHTKRSLREACHAGVARCACGLQGAINTSYQVLKGLGAEDRLWAPASAPHRIASCRRRAGGARAAAWVNDAPVRRARFLVDVDTRARGHASRRDAAHPDWPLASGCETLPLYLLRVSLPLTTKIVIPAY